jgi:hypothetical protein
VGPILEACRDLLLKQFREVFPKEAEAKALAFERTVCKQLGFTSTPASPKDFDAAGVLATAKAGTLLNIPDMFDRMDRKCTFANKLGLHQEDGLALLRELPELVSATSDVDSRLGLLRVAMSAAILHYPGTEHHEEAIDLAWRAATHAEVPRLMYSPLIDDETRGKALGVWRMLHTARFIPTLESPLNHARQAVGKKRLPESAWNAVSMSLDAAMHSSLVRTKVVDKNLESILNLCSTLSLKSRGLVLRGDAASIREADEIDLKTKRICESLPFAYGHLYQLIRDIALGKTPRALKYCEDVIDLHEKTGDRETAAAFAGLHVQLRFDENKRPPPNDEYVKRVRPYLDSKPFLYRFSHLADFPRLRVLLDRRFTKGVK